MGLFNFIKNAGSELLKNKASKYEAKEKDDSAMKERQEGLLEGIIEGAGINVANVDVEIENDVVKIWGEAETEADREKAILILGNMNGVASIDDRISVVGASEVSAPAAPAATMYEVQPGDSLSKIAKAHYGDPMKYKEIFEANQPMLKDPNVIFPGQTLRIPTL